MARCPPKIGKYPWNIPTIDDTSPWLTVVGACYLTRRWRHHRDSRRDGVRHLDAAYGIRHSLRATTATMRIW
jgi:hypothetical protein